MVPGPRSGWLAQSTRSLSRLRDLSIKFRQARARLGPHARLWARRRLALLQDGHESMLVTECDPTGGRRSRRIEAKGESGRTHRGGRGAAIAGNSVGVGASLVWAAACVWSRGPDSPTPRPEHGFVLVALVSTQPATTRGPAPPRLHMTPLDIYLENVR